MRESRTYGSGRGACHEMHVPTATQRREFITLLGGAAAAWPVAARAQQPANAHRIAVVRPSGSVADMTEAGGNPSYRALFNELRRLGYVERQNLIVERYSGEGHQERFAELAREVVRTKPHLIFVASTPLVLIFKAATDTIPIVGIMADPVAMGVVSNLARPDGNVTGISVDAGLEIWAKRLQILQEVVPTAKKRDTCICAPAGTLLREGLCRRPLGGWGLHCLARRSNTPSKKPNIGACWERCRASTWMGSLSVT